MLKINVTEYNPQWPAHFEQIRIELEYALSDFLPSNTFEIYHVGSTSVPGLAAKPIIDIDIVVAPDLIMEATQALTSYGYTYAYERGGIDRMVFRYNKHKLDSGASTPTEDGTPRRAVYLNKIGGGALTNHLALRELLRTNERVRDEYGALKLELAKEDYTSIGAYGGKKHGLISNMLEKSGLTEEEVLRVRNKPKRRVDEKLAAAVQVQQ